MIVLQSKVTELEEELFKTKDQLRLVRSEWDHDKQDLQQVRREGEEGEREGYRRGREGGREGGNGRKKNIK